MLQYTSLANKNSGLRLTVLFFSQWSHTKSLRAKLPWKAHTWDTERASSERASRTLDLSINVDVNIRQAHYREHLMLWLAVS